MQELQKLIGKEYGEIKAKEFEDFICNILEKKGKIQRQVLVKNRGDGMRGKVDLVWHTEGKIIGIEIDRKTARKKSIFKLYQLQADERWVILRSPFSLCKYQ